MRSSRSRRVIAGPTTRAAAKAAGHTDHELRRPSMHRLSRDTYLPRALEDDLDARIAAVLMTAPSAAVVSHGAAAALWGVQIPMTDRQDRRVDLIVDDDGRAESRSDRRIHRVGVAPDEVTTCRGLPVTSRARTWRDLAGVLEPPALLAVTDQVLARCPAAELAEQLRRRPSGRGAARARRVLPLGDPRSESPMESVIRWLIHAAGLPSPVVQHVVRDALGRHLARADLAWPEQKVIVEFDGDVHRQREVFVSDNRRQNRLVAEGWVVLRFTSADVLGRPAEVVAEIRRALRR